eukprot:9467502-Pyramimonas_sp.AAC.1
MSARKSRQSGPWTLPLRPVTVPARLVSSRSLKLRHRGSARSQAQQRRAPRRPTGTSRSSGSSAAASTPDELMAFESAPGSTPAAR